LEWVLRAGEGVPADEKDDVLCCPASVIAVSLPNNQRHHRTPPSMT
jgi:hypothetical protein